MMIAGSLISAALLATVPLAAALHKLELGQVFAVSFLTSTAGLFAGLAAGAYLPALVGRDRLVEANGKQATTRSTTSILGPSLLRIRGRGRCSKNWWWASGSSSATRFCACWSASSAASTCSPAWRRRSSSSTWPVSCGCRRRRSTSFSPPPWPGALVAALIARRVSGRLGIGATIVVGGLIFGIGWAIAPLVGGPPALAAIMLMATQFLLNGGAQLANINSQSLIQAITPDRMLGPVGGSLLIVYQGVVPVGAVTGGLLGQFFGPRAALAVAAVGTLLAMAFITASPLRGVRSADVPAIPVPPSTPS